MTLHALLAAALSLGIGAGTIMLWPEPAAERVLPRAEAVAPSRPYAPAIIIPATDACTPSLPAPRPPAQI